MFYRHDGSDNLIDSFDFKFRDFYGLETDLETMHIRATSKDMLIWVRKLIILMMIKIYKINFLPQNKVVFSIYSNFRTDFCLLGQGTDVNSLHKALFQKWHQWNLIMQKITVITLKSNFENFRTSVSENMFS